MTARTVSVLLAALCAAIVLPCPARGDLMTDLNSVIVYPNPFQPRLAHTSVVFGNLTQDARLRIYTVSGRLVYEASSEATAGALDWTVVNGSGESVASGVYVYILTNDAGQKNMGKIIILK